MKIGLKLKLNALVVMVLLATNVGVAIYFFDQMQKAVRQVIDIEEPLEQAILEMEINAGDTARAVFHYIWSPEAEDIERVLDSERDFEASAREFDRLATSDEERELGRKVTGLYREFRILGGEIMGLSRRHFNDLRRFRRKIATIDELIDEKLHPYIDRSAPGALDKIEAVLAMEISIDHAIAAIEGYILDPDPPLKGTIAKAEEAYDRYQSLYRATGLTADEERWLDAIDKAFRDAKAVGNAIIALADRMHADVGKFQDYLERIDQLVDDEVEVPLFERTRRSAITARQAGEVGIAVVIIVGLLIFACTAIASWYLSNSIVEGVKRLSDGAQEFGRGNLDYRIEAREKDELGALVAVFNDMAERRKSDEVALRDSEARQSDLLNNTSSIIYMKDTNRRYTFINRKFEEVFHVKNAAVLGKTDSDIFASATAEVCGANDLQALAADAPLEFEETIPHDDGAHTYLSVKYPLKSSSGEVYAVCSIATDITDIKNLEAQLRRSQRMEAVGQLTGGIAHDFNNLLASIIGNTEMLGDRIGSDEKSKRHIDALMLAVDRASALTQRLLAFSRKQTLLPVVADISDLIGGLEDLLQRALGETVELIVDASPRPLPAKIDPHQFENALLNLAINARDAMVTGGTLKVQTGEAVLDQAYATQHEEVKPGDYVQVSVSDTGKGMDSNVLEKAFEPFFTTKGVGEGSGLGLSMVYGFVKQSEGHITIESVPGQGTTVSLYLPRTSETVKREAQPSDPEHLVPGSENILLVEDDERVREVSSTILRDKGYRVIEATNGEEALQHLKQGPAFDLLFTDVVLPGGMNGFDIAKSAARLQPTLKILYTTGYAEDETTDFNRPELEDVMINKPYRRAMLLEKVRAVLGDSDDARITGALRRTEQRGT